MSVADLPAAPAGKAGKAEHLAVVGADGSPRLMPGHLAQLRASGLTDESIELGGFYSTTDTAHVLDALGRKPRSRWTGGACLMLPFYVPGSSAPVFHRVRPDVPVLNKDGKPMKYCQPSGVGVMPYLPARTRLEGRLTSSAPIVITEGEKKAALLDQLGYCVIGLTGVTCFHDSARWQTERELEVHPEIAKHVSFTDRLCFIAFDSDYATNPNVVREADHAAYIMRHAGAKDVRILAIPMGETGPDGKPGKLGIDDFYALHGEQATRRLFADASPTEGRKSEGFEKISSFPSMKDAPGPDGLRVPLGWSIGRSGELLREKEVGSGEAKKTIMVQAEHSPMLLTRLVSDLYTGHEQVEIAYQRAGAWRSVVMPRRTIADSRACVSDMAPLGAPVDSGTAGDVVEWLRSFEALNEPRLPRAQSVARCGWHEVGGKHVFALGSHVTGESGLIVDRVGTGARLFRGLTMSGDLESHKAALAKAWAASPVCAVAICAALAAPLLKILGAPSFAVHLSGDSSRGKSSMLKIAASIFGNPADDEWLAAWNATLVGLEIRASMLCDLPLCIDEAGTSEASERTKSTYMLVNGTGRTRGAKDGGLRDGHSWRTVVISTGEERLVSTNAPTGAQVRVIDLAVDGFGAWGAKEIDACKRDAEAHHGQIGRAWIEWLAACTPEAREKLRADLVKRRAEYAARAAPGSLAARQAEFWAILGHAEACAHLALGLGELGGRTVARLFTAQQDEGTACVERVRPASERALEVVSEWVARERLRFPDATIDVSGRKYLAWPNGQPREAAGFVDTDALCVFTSALEERLRKSGIDSKIALREWARTGVTLSEAGRTGGRVRIEGQQVRVVKILPSAVGIGDEEAPVDGRIGGAHAEAN